MENQPSKTRRAFGAIGVFLKSELKWSATGMALGMLAVAIIVGIGFATGGTALPVVPIIMGFVFPTLGASIIGAFLESIPKARNYYNQSINAVKASPIILEGLNKTSGLLPKAAAPQFTKSFNDTKLQGTPLQSPQSGDARVDPTSPTKHNKKLN